MPLVERLSRFVCRDTRLSAADVDDFVSYVMLKLIDDDYAVLRNFEGRCQMSSYVIVVVRRALSDFVAQERGKYRPSREAQRQGEIGLELADPESLRLGGVAGDVLRREQTDRSPGAQLAAASRSC